MGRPGRNVLVAFALVTLVGGTNFVAVRFSDRELAPFWGAGLRFTLAAALLLAFSVWRRIPLPPRALLGRVTVFGIVNFGLVYAFAYYGLVDAPAAVAATLVAIAPLLTFLMATVLGMERFRWGGLVGALISLAGIAVVFGDQLRFDVPFMSLIALFFNALGIATGTILLKRMPRTHPIGTNAVAMIPGALLLLVLAAIAREPMTLPTRPDATIALLYLVTIGSIGLFGGIVYLLQRWTASATAYTTVLFPVVAVAVGALLAGEMVTAQLIVGAILVMVGTYVGVLVRPRAETEVEEAAA